MSTLATATFWKSTAERAVKTFAQVAGATIIASGVLGLFDLNYLNLISIAGLGTLLSVLTPIGSAGIGGEGASLVVEETPLK